MTLPGWMKSKPAIYGGIAVAVIAALAILRKRGGGGEASQAESADDGAALSGPAVLFAGGPSLAAPGTGNWESALPPSSGSGTDWALSLAGSQVLGELASQALLSMPGKAGWKFEGSLSPDGAGGITLSSEVTRGGFNFRDYLLGWEHDNAAPVSGGPLIDTAPVPPTAVTPSAPITASNPTGQQSGGWVNQARDSVPSAPAPTGQTWIQSAFNAVRNVVTNPPGSWLLGPLQPVEPSDSSSR